MNPVERMSEDGMSNFDRTGQQAAFDEIVSALGAASARLPADPLTGFMAMEGASYSGDLMWVGRAVNGWRGIERSPRELGNPASAADFHGQRIARCRAARTRW